MTVPMITVSDRTTASRVAVIRPHRLGRVDAGQSRPSRKAAAHDGSRFLWMLYEPHRGSEPAHGEGCIRQHRDAVLCGGSRIGRVVAAY
ncbi:MAG: hypothetical protein LC775_00670 [Acidobacteria bacterium]|nr:hypothetical protein [Acidobacteriota bacterium]